MSEVEKLYNPLIGQQVGFGQCGSLTSDYFQYKTGYNFADSVSNPAPRLPTAPTTGYFATAWGVYTQVDWEAVGYEYINNPTLEQVRDDDMFFIAPRPGLPTGHTGTVASVVNGNITTFEQNVQGALYVQKLPGANSWSWYGGFDGIVRKKSSAPQPTEEGEIEMYLIYTIDTKNWYVSNGGQCKWVKTERMLKNYQNDFGKLNLRVDKMYSTELYKEFPKEDIIK